MQQQKTRYDKLLDRIKNNPIAAVLLITSSAIIGIGAVLFTIVRIVEFFGSDIGTSRPEISGRWESNIVQYEVAGTDADYKFVFNFTQTGDSVSGKVQREYLTLERDDSWTVLGGILEDKTITFYTKDTYENIQRDSIRGLWTERTEYRANYKGVINGDEIQFSSEDDRGYGPIEFIATRKDN